MQNDVKLFAQLYIATQVRGGDIDELFKHETRNSPPSLSKNGEIRSGNKADLLHCMPLVASEKDEVNTEASVLEGSVLVNILKPGAANTFEEYSETVFNPVALQDLKEHIRIDVIFDSYKEKSLKLTTMKKRGKGIRRKVESESQPQRTGHLFSGLMRTSLSYLDFSKIGPFLCIL